MAFDSEIVLTRRDDNFTAPDTSDKIKGMGGDDTINGGGGDDEIFGDTNGLSAFVNDGRDTLHGNAGDDILHGGGDDDKLFGDANSDTLFGDGGDDILDGGTGNDTMKGGLGDDTYIVDSLGDVVDDIALGGTDVVKSSISYNLNDAHHVENLTLIGAANISGTGDDRDNVIIGNNAGNRLDGGAGSDIMRGEGGNDTFIINSSSGTDALIDGGADTDKVESSVSFSLAASTTNVENLTLTGGPTAVINGTGNSLDNTLIGNGANNVLSGGDGNDTLRGDYGNDTLFGGDDADDLDGGFDNDTLNGDAGADILDGNAGRDRYNGGSQNDILVYDANDFSVGATAGQYDGGSGQDTLQLKSGAALSTTLDLRTLDNSLISNVEVLDLRQGSNNAHVFLEFSDVFSINSGHSLRIDGDAKDKLTVTDFGWDDTTQQQTIGGQVYDVYTNGAATLLVDADMQISGSFT
jgi:Ca2+-binding RTX toxin-like protein